MSSFFAISKVRPVGSRVPAPASAPWPAWPWENRWLSRFTPSGTAALSLAVALACQSRADADFPEVVIPAYGCPDLVAAIVARGARPVLVDLEADTPCMDLEALEKACGASTVAIVAVDFLGLPERLQAISAIARRRGILVIEDSAQRFPPAALASDTVDCVVVSFGRGKPINLMGGGLLLARKGYRADLEALTGKLPVFHARYGLREHLKHRIFNLLLSRWIYGWLERLTFLHLGETRFKALTTYGLWEPPESMLAGGLAAYERRPDWAAVYDWELAFIEDAGWRCLSLQHRDAASGPLLRYPILAPDRDTRDRALAYLNEEGIGANAFYGASLPKTRGTAEYLGNTPRGPFPRAEDFADRLIVLPCHEDTTEADILRVSGVLRKLIETFAVRS